jgi:hypothetical protein
VGNDDSRSTVPRPLRYHAHYGTVGTGHLYQSRFKAFSVETETYLLRLFRYVVRNPLRANLVTRAENGRWSGLWDYAHDTNIGVPLAPWPIPRPANWLEYVNQPQTDSEVEAIRRSIQRGISRSRLNTIGADRADPAKRRNDHNDMLIHLFAGSDNLTPIFSAQL